MKKSAVLIAALATPALLACERTADRPATTPVAQQQQVPTEVAGPGAAPGEVRERANPCPMEVAGTNVQMTEIEDGVILTFTSQRDVNELRRRVEQLATVHNRMGDMSQQQRGMQRDEHDAHGGARGMGMMPQVEAHTEQMEDGIRLILVAEDPEQLEQVREHARMMTQRMQAGECPGMDMQQHMQQMQQRMRQQQTPQRTEDPDTFDEPAPRDEPDTFDEPAPRDEPDPFDEPAPRDEPDPFEEPGAPETDPY